MDPIFGYLGDWRCSCDPKGIGKMATHKARGHTLKRWALHIWMHKAAVP
jgi:hypothetical protein